MAKKRPTPSGTPSVVDGLLARAAEAEREGRIDTAVNLLHQAVGAAPLRPEPAYHLGRLFCCQNRPAEAVTVFTKALAHQKNQHLIWAGLANAYYLAGNFHQALTHYRQAARLAPGDPTLPAAMANVHHRMGRPEAAVNALSEAIVKGADDPRLHHNLGHLLTQLGRSDEALSVLRKAVRRFETHAGLWVALGNLLFDAGNTNEALEALQRAVDLDPDDAYTRRNLARKLHKAGLIEAAAAAYHEVVARHPEDETAAHCLAALTGRTTSAAPLSYVRDGFDRYAERFDKHLVEGLGYATPNLLRRELEAAAAGVVFARAVDLGCGTGLSGAPFRDVCHHLTGIDLSGRMLEKAREKGIYDRLCQAEAIAFLNDTAEGFDLVIAADMLVYIGDLEPLFAAVGRGTLPGAVFLCSTECSDMNADYTLNQTGRYAHHRDYVRRLADAHGFDFFRTNSANLRKERGQWVTGDLFVLKRRLEAASPEK